MTWYEIDIDQRGCIAESCCDDPGWNPTMGVAAQGDDERWRIEGQIPFSQMVPRAAASRRGLGTGHRAHCADREARGLDSTGLHAPPTRVVRVAALSISSERL